MRFLLTMIALATGLVGALDSSDDLHVCKPKNPDFSQIPQCAVNCIVRSASAATACSTNPPDYKCWCTPVNFSAIIQAGAVCVEAACGEDVANTMALPAFQKFCCEVNARGIIW